MPLNGKNGLFLWILSISSIDKVPHLHVSLFPEKGRKAWLSGLSRHFERIELPVFLGTSRKSNYPFDRFGNFDPRQQTKNHWPPEVRFASLAKPRRRTLVATSAVRSAGSIAQNRRSGRPRVVLHKVSLAKTKRTAETRDRYVNTLATLLHRAGRSSAASGKDCFHG